MYLRGSRVFADGNTGYFEFSNYGSDRTILERFYQTLSGFSKCKMYLANFSFLISGSTTIGTVSGGFRNYEVPSGRSLSQEDLESFGLSIEVTADEFFLPGTVPPPHSRLISTELINFSLPSRLLHNG